MKEFFTAAPENRNELHPIEKAGLWGYADEKGNTVIAPLWDEAFDFTDRTAVVRLADKYHMIDRRGKTVINGRGWECIKSAGAGYAAVKSGGKWGV